MAEAPLAAPIVDTGIPAPPVADVAPLAAAPVAPVAVDVAPPAADPHPVEVPSLLDAFGKDKAAPEAKAPEAVPPVVDAKPDAKPDAAQEAAPEAPPPAPVVPEKVEWKFELPETLKADEPTMQRFTGVLDELLTPKEGETRVQAGQRLLELHNEKMTEYAQQLQRDQIKAFNDTRSEWQKQVLADERIGGAGHQTAMGAIARMRDLTISDHKAGSTEYQKDVAEFEHFLRITGAGDHPAYLKQLHRFARFFDEPALPPPNPKPPANIGQNPNRRGLYANSPSTRS